MSAEVIALPTAAREPVRNPPCRIVPRPYDPELEMERDRLHQHMCRHDDGRTGFVEGVYRDGLAIMAKLCRGYVSAPVRACRLTPTGGRAA